MLIYSYSTAGSRKFNMGTEKRSEFLIRGHRGNINGELKAKCIKK